MRPVNINLVSAHSRGTNGCGMAETNGWRPGVRVRDHGMAMESLGVLLLHGFTSTLDTVRALCPLLTEAGLPYRMPVLRGHGLTPEALRQVRAQDWIDDARAALDDLLREVDCAVVVGLSMGGLVALTLAAERPERLAGIVAVVPALRFVDWRAPFSPLLHGVIRRVSTPPVPPGETYISTNYTWVLTRSFVELYRFGQQVERRLSEVRVPLLVIGARHDRVVRPECAELTYQKVSSTDKALRIFERSGHEMLQSSEREQVFAEILSFIEHRRASLRIS
jgi:carboxylesterase